MSNSPRYPLRSHSNTTCSPSNNFLPRTQSNSSNTNTPGPRRSTRLTNATRTRSHINLQDYGSSATLRKTISLSKFDQPNQRLGFTTTISAVPPTPQTELIRPPTPDTQIDDAVPAPSSPMRSTPSVVHHPHSRSVTRSPPTPQSLPSTLYTPTQESPTAITEPPQSPHQCLPVPPTSINGIRPNPDMVLDADYLHALPNDLHDLFNRFRSKGPVNKSLNGAKRRIFRAEVRKFIHNLSSEDDNAREVAQLKLLQVGTRLLSKKGAPLGDHSKSRSKTHSQHLPDKVRRSTEITTDLFLRGKISLAANSASHPIDPDGPQDQSPSLHAEAIAKSKSKLRYDQKVMYPPLPNDAPVTTISHQRSNLLSNQSTNHPITPIFMGFQLIPSLISFKTLKPLPISSISFQISTMDSSLKEFVIS